MNNINGKSFLICQPMMHWYTGSTIVTLELAEFLQQSGAKVEIYTVFLDEPIKTELKKRKIETHDSFEKIDYKLKNYDYIWVHSQVLPTCIIDQLAQELPEKMPKFIFLHMSAADWIPDEKPWIYDLENRLSSKSLFICEEVEKVNEGLLSQKVSRDFFRNPAPVEFSKITPRNSKEVEKVLVVSNHPPQEIYDAAEILRKDYSVNVDFLGENEDNYKLASPDLLKNYDVIITIGKTVQYCLVANIPVYIYDIFAGGVGYLNSDNLDSATKRNFSGYENRFYKNAEGDGFCKKTPEKIAKEIINNYTTAKKFQNKNLENFRKKFLISNVLPGILNSTKGKTIKKFDKKYKETILQEELFATERFRAASYLWNQTRNRRNLEKKNRQNEEQINELRRINEENKKILSSGLYVLFGKITKPYVATKELIREKITDKRDFLSIREIQLAELGILKDFVAFCNQNNLKYYLYGGTALGAIRHHGFIPWDDDVDVVMPRPDYEKMRQTIPQDKTMKKYYLYDPEKIRKPDFLFVKIYDKRYKCFSSAHGADSKWLYIDILPIDGMPEEGTDEFLDKIIKERNKFLDRRDQKYKLDYHLTDENERDSLKKVPYDTIVANNYKLARKYQFEKSKYVCDTVWAINHGNILEKSWLDPPRKVQFEGLEMNVFGEVEKYLERRYGDDYMEIPPPEKRESHYIKAWKVGKEKK